MNEREERAGKEERAGREKLAGREGGREGGEGRPTRPGWVTFPGTAEGQFSGTVDSCWRLCAGQQPMWVRRRRAST